MSEFKNLVGTSTAFLAEMLARLETKNRQGWTGWGDKTMILRFKSKIVEKAQEIYESEISQIDEKECIDLANYVMFLWNIKRKLKE